MLKGKHDDHNYASILVENFHVNKPICKVLNLILLGKWREAALFSHTCFQLEILSPFYFLPNGKDN